MIGYELSVDKPVKTRSLLLVSAALWLLPPIALLASSVNDKVYIRSLVFSEIYSDQDIPDERSLEQLLSKKDEIFSGR